MRAKEFLNKIIDLKINLDILEKEYETYLERSTFITPSYKSDCVQESNCNDKISTNAIKMADMRNEINAVWDEYIDHKRECLTILFQINDKKCRKLLYYKYFKDLKWKQIADIIDCTEETTRGYKHEQSLKIFEKLLKSNKTIRNYTL